MGDFKIISKPPKPRYPMPPWWRKLFLKSGTIVSYKGVRWVLVWTGAGDQTWKEWSYYDG